MHHLSHNVTKLVPCVRILASLHAGDGVIQQSDSHRKSNLVKKILLDSKVRYG